MRLTGGMHTGVSLASPSSELWELWKNYEVSPLSLATVAGMGTCRYMPASINVCEVYDKVSPLLAALLPRKGGHFFFPVCAANNSRNSKSPPISPLPFPGSFPLGLDKTSPRYSSFFRTLEPWHAQAPGEQRPPQSSYSPRSGQAMAGNGGCRKLSCLLCAWSWNRCNQ